MLVALEQLDPSRAANPEAFKSGLEQSRGGMSKVVDGGLIARFERSPEVKRELTALRSALAMP